MSALIARVLEYRVFAIVVMTGTPPSRIVEECLGNGVPVILVNKLLPGLAVDTVVADHAAGGRLAAEQLLTAGCRRLGVVSSAARTASLIGRLDAFRARAGRRRRAGARLAGRSHRLRSGPRCRARDARRSAARRRLLRHRSARARLPRCRALGMRSPRSRRSVASSASTTFRRPPGARIGLTTFRQPVGDLTRRDEAPPSARARTRPRPRRSRRSRAARRALDRARPRSGPERIVRRPAGRRPPRQQRAHTPTTAGRRSKRPSPKAPTRSSAMSRRRATACSSSATTSRSTSAWSPT